MDALLLATGNAGKIRELRTLLAPRDCIAQAELGITSPAETGSTFVENALQKAHYAAHAGNLPCLAEDSGLVVPALGGEPGIFSARYCGEQASDEDNIAHLLHRMEGLSARAAYFYCAMVYLPYPGCPTPLIATGRVDGFISLQPEGTAGFGYDPVFYYPPEACTFARLPVDFKNTVSHRAQALTQLCRQLP